MGIADIDGDGFTDIVAAGYTAGQVYVFTYAGSLCDQYHECWNFVFFTKIILTLDIVIESE